MEQGLVEGTSEGLSTLHNPQSRPPSVQPGPARGPLAERASAGLARAPRLGGGGGGELGQAWARVRGRLSGPPAPPRQYALGRVGWPVEGEAAARMAGLIGAG